MRQQKWRPSTAEMALVQADNLLSRSGNAKKTRGGVVDKVHLYIVSNLANTHNTPSSLELFNDTAEATNRQPQILQSCEITFGDIDVG
jgi:hypothetical protein